MLLGVEQPVVMLEFSVYLPNFVILHTVVVIVVFSFSIKNIGSKVSIQQKSRFISRLHGYWQLKRQSLNGVPLRRATRVSARQVIRSRVRPHTRQFHQ